MIAVLPVGMNYRTERFPIVTLSIIGLNTLVYLITLVSALNTGGDSNLWFFQHLWLIPDQSLWWTYFTSMFVHAGIFHLLGNMIFLFLFGCCVEDILGRVRFAAYYLASGIIAALAYIAFAPAHFASNIPMGGASGAITACMGMYLLLRTNSDIEFKYFLWFFFVFFRVGEFTLPAWVAITFWFLKDLLFMVLGFAAHQRGGGTAFGAHVGGFLTGLGLVAAYQWLGRQPKAPAENKNLIINPQRIRMNVPLRSVASSAETPTIYLHDGTQQTGPFTLSQVQAMLQCGSIGGETEYWSEGLDDWQKVAELSGRPLE